MSSQIEDIEAGVPRYYGMQLGTVTDVEDPRGLHRVKVSIPAIAEPSTDWLFPMIMGGGSAQRGGHAVPDVGATCAVWFHNGDPNGQGMYAPVAWSAPDDGDPEIPHDALQAKGDAHLIQTMRFGRVVCTIDEREGKEAFRLYDAKGGFNFQVDLVKKVVSIEGLVGLLLKSTGQINIDGLEVIIKGRRVADTSDHV